MFSHIIFFVSLVSLFHVVHNQCLCSLTNSFVSGTKTANGGKIEKCYRGVEIMIHQSSTILVLCDCSKYPCTEKSYESGSLGKIFSRGSKSKMTLEKRFLLETWGAWSRWSHCTATCGSGVAFRGRSCPPGSTCSGLHADIRPCRALTDCIADDHWRTWMAWTACSVTSGLGSKERIRHCELADHSCYGPYNQITTCCISQCPGKGKWASWETWSTCSRTCGNYGQKSRTRVCIPSFESGPLPPLCIGNNYEVRQCKHATCVDIHETPYWENWSAWSGCTCQTCPCSGQRFRIRKCNVEHACDGIGFEAVSCQKQCQNSQSFSLDGAWADWQQWSSCLGKCQQSTQYRVRTCTQPQPRNGGQKCPGNFEEHRTCQSDNCPVAVDGHWGPWNSWTYCSVSCGLGTKQRSRPCNNPRPQNGGNYCSPPLAYTEKMACNEMMCPVAKWSAWLPWEQCSKQCGDGMQIRLRTCGHGNDSCVGTSTEQRACTGHVCPVNGNWSPWRAWKSCSLTCGNGTKTRTRTCSNPSPANGGTQCAGLKTDRQDCNIQQCPVDGHWNDWMPWSRCTVTCGKGVQTRNRACVNPVPSHGGSYCVGNETETFECSNADCVKIDGQWSIWMPWSRCTTTCGEGTRTRNRACVNPVPQNNGRYCIGNDTQTTKCLQAPCSTIGNFSCYTCDKALDQSYCDQYYRQTVCSAPYCINHVTNYQDGTRVIDRRCGTLQECDQDWWHGTSDVDKCMQMDITQTLNLDISCVFCCVNHLCNQQIIPSHKTLYSN